MIDSVIKEFTTVLAQHKASDYEEAAVVLQENYEYVDFDEWLTEHDVSRRDIVRLCSHDGVDHEDMMIRVVQVLGTRAIAEYLK
jgi:hypothetical protein